MTFSCAATRLGGGVVDAAKQRAGRVDPVPQLVTELLGVAEGSFDALDVTFERVDRGGVGGERVDDEQVADLVEPSLQILHLPVGLLAEADCLGGRGVERRLRGARGGARADPTRR